MTTDEELRQKSLELAHDGLAGYGLGPATTEQIVDRAEEFYRFLTASE